MMTYRFLVLWKLIFFANFSYAKKNILPVGVVSFKDNHLFLKNKSNEINGVDYELKFYKDNGERYGILELGIPMKGTIKYYILPVLEHSKGKCDLVVKLKIKGKKPKLIYAGYFLKSRGTWVLKSYKDINIKKIKITGQTNKP